MRRKAETVVRKQADIEIEVEIKRKSETETGWSNMVNRPDVLLKKVDWGRNLGKAIKKVLEYTIKFVKKLKKEMFNIHFLGEIENWKVESGHVHTCWVQDKNLLSLIRRPFLCENDYPA